MGDRRPLGRMLARAIEMIESEAGKDLLVVAVPLFPSKERERGYNQAVLILPICCAVDQLRRLDASARIVWLVVIVLVVYFLPTAVDEALTRVYHSEAYQVIPVMCLLPVVVILQWQAARKFASVR